jgi:hypothetical protein
MLLGASDVSSFCIQSVCNTREHGRATGEDNVAVEVTTDIEVTLDDRVVCHLVNTSQLTTDEQRLEESFRCTEPDDIASVFQVLVRANFDGCLPLVADGDDLTVRKLVALLESRCGDTVKTGEPQKSPFCWKSQREPRQP